MGKNLILEAAYKYFDQGFSVIPVGRDKKPLIPWALYQKTRADRHQIREWWGNWPNANIAIVTGKISGITVIDADSEKGRDSICEFINDSLVTPISKTPRGWHYYFEYEPGIANSVKSITDCDVRSDGGYIIAPPSRNGKGSYAWQDGFDISQTDLSPIPGMLSDILKVGGSHSLNANAINKDSSTIEGVDPSVYKSLQLSSNVFKAFSQGSRDNTIFHIANVVLKGGMHENEAEILVCFIAKHCTPPFPEKDALLKLQSALKRVNSRSSSFASDVRDFVLSSNGIFTSADIYTCLHLSSRQEKKNVSLTLSRMVDERIIERVGKRNGHFRRLDHDLAEMDFLSAPTETIDLWLPFGIHNMVETMPGNIILIAGEPNAGKTAFLLNIIRKNMENFKVHYFNSEMGEVELRKRLSNFDEIPLSDWKFRAYERSGDFADVIKSGKGNINIIDFLEIYENFYEVNGMLASIHKKLNGALAIVALQKNPGTDIGLGGYRTLEKPRLALAMSPSKLKIVKAKNWKGGANNPNKQAIDFKLAAGCKLFSKGDWYQDQKIETSK